MAQRIWLTGVPFPIISSLLFRQFVIAYFEQKGYSLGVDCSYSGTIVSIDYYLKNNTVYSILLEVNRKLYINETSKELKQFDETKQVVKGFLNMLKMLMYPRYYV